MWMFVRNNHKTAQKTPFRRSDFSVFQFFCEIEKKLHKAKEKGKFLSISMIFMRVWRNDDGKSCAHAKAGSFDLTIMSDADELYKNGYLC